MNEISYAMQSRLEREVEDLKLDIKKGLTKTELVSEVVFSEKEFLTGYRIRRDKSASDRYYLNSTERCQALIEQLQNLVKKNYAVYGYELVFPELTRKGKEIYGTARIKNISNTRKQGGIMVTYRLFSDINNLIWEFVEATCPRKR